LIPDGVSEDDSNPITLHGFDKVNQSVSVRDFFGGLLRSQLSNLLSRRATLFPELIF
jgi:hypothetical protein